MPQPQIARIPDVYNVRCEYGVAAPDADASVLSASCCRQQGRKF
jgi:hypothetical protein